MTWAQRLERVFGNDIEICPDWHGAVRIIACMEDLKAKEKILAHLAANAEPEALRRPRCRARPSAGCSTEPDDPTTTTQAAAPAARLRWRLA